MCRCCAVLLLWDGISLEGGGERWMSCCCSRKEALVSPERGTAWAALFHFSGRNAAALPAAPPNTESKHRSSRQTWCLTQTRCCLLSWLLGCADFCISLFVLPLPLHMADSLSVIWHPPLPSSPNFDSIFMNVCSISWKPRRPSRVWRAPTSSWTVWVQRMFNGCLTFTICLV